MSRAWDQGEPQASWTAVASAARHAFWCADHTPKLLKNRRRRRRFNGAVQNLAESARGLVNPQDLSHRPSFWVNARRLRKRVALRCLRTPNAQQNRQTSRVG